MLSLGSSCSTWLTPCSSTTFSAVCLSASMRGLLGFAVGLTVAVRARQQDGSACGHFRGQRQWVDLVRLGDGLHVARVDDRVEPLRELVGHRAFGPDFVDGGQPRRQRLGACIAAHPVGDDVEVAAGQRLKQAQRVDLRRAGRGVGRQRHRMDGALAEAVHRDARLVGAGLIGEVTNRCVGTRGIDGADDIVRPLLVWAEAGLAGTDLVVAQAGDAAVRELFGQLPHVADGTDDRVVAVAVGRPAFGDQQHRGSWPRVLLVPVGAVDGQAVGVEADVVVDPADAAHRTSSRPAPVPAKQQEQQGLSNADLDP